MNELTGTVDVRVGGRNQVRTNSILTFAKKAVVGWIAVLGLLAQSSRVEADRDVLLTYLSARKTLRLPRRLRRGGMSDLGSGLHARYPDQFGRATVAIWFSGVHPMRSTTPCTLWFGRPSIGGMSWKVRSNSGYGNSLPILRSNMTLPWRKWRSVQTLSIFFAPSRLGIPSARLLLGSKA